MYCSKCGSKIADDSKFCANCGQIVEGGSVEQKQGKPTDTKKQGTNKFMIVAIALIIIVVIGIVIAVSGKKEIADGTVADTVQIENEKKNTEESEKDSLFEKNNVQQITADEFITLYNESLLDSADNGEEIYFGTDEEYINAATTLLSQQLKNPSTAQIQEKKIYEKDEYGRAIVYIDVSAQNGLGGWSRYKLYYCINKVTPDGQFGYNSMMYYCEDNSELKLLKGMNGFGADSRMSVVGDYYWEEDKAHSNTKLPVPDYNILTRYHNFGDFVIRLHVDKDVDKVCAVEVLTNSNEYNNEDFMRIYSCLGNVFTNKGREEIEKIVGDIFDVETMTTIGDGHKIVDDVYYEAYDVANHKAVAMTAVDSNFNDSVWTPGRTEKMKVVEETAEQNVGEDISVVLPTDFVNQICGEYYSIEEEYLDIRPKGSTIELWINQSAWGEVTSMVDEITFAGQKNDGTKFEMICSDGMININTADREFSFMPLDYEPEVRVEYILPNSDSDYLSEIVLYDLSANERRLARNEIYARHGRIFNDEELRNYFESKAWYTPTISAEDFTDDLLNDYELSNLQMMEEYERSIQ